MQRMQEEGYWKHRGGAKLQVQSKPTHEENNFGDSEYEVMAWHEDCMKEEREIEKQLYELKQQLKEEQELHRQENELQ